MGNECCVWKMRFSGSLALGLSLPPEVTLRKVCNLKAQIHLSLSGVWLLAVSGYQQQLCGGLKTYSLELSVFF